MKTERSKKNRILLKILKKLLLLILVLIVVGNLIFAVSDLFNKNIKLFRTTFFTINSYSMGPALRPKDIALIRKAEVNELELEDIIAYTKGGETRITRVVNMRENRGEKSFLIKADNHYYLEEITADDVIGKITNQISGTNILLNILRSRALTVLIIIYLILLVRYKRRMRVKNQQRRELKQNVNI